jgi:hypothetical protein
MPVFRYFGAEHGCRTSGGEGGIRTLDTGVSPYNGLAIVDEPSARFGSKELHSPEASTIRFHSTLSVGYREPVCEPTVTCLEVALYGLPKIGFLGLIDIAG